MPPRSAASRHAPNNAHTPAGMPRGRSLHDVPAGTHPPWVPGTAAATGGRLPRTLPDAQNVALFPQAIDGHADFLPVAQVRLGVHT